KLRAARARLADRGGFPLRLARQPTSRPAAPGLRLVPIDEGDRRVGRKRFGRIVAAPCPGTVPLRQPIDRSFGTRGLPPGPAFLAPKLAGAIAARRPRLPSPQLAGVRSPPASTKAAYSAFVTGALAMQNGSSSTACAHFSLSNTKPSAAVEPSCHVPPGTATSPGNAPARGVCAGPKSTGAG